MLFLLSITRGRGDQRTNALVAIGLVAIAAGDHTKPYLARVLDVIRSTLPSKVLTIVIY